MCFEGKLWVILEAASPDFHCKLMMTITIGKPCGRNSYIPFDHSQARHTIVT